MEKKKIEVSNVVDTLDLARNKYPGSGNSLDALCKRYRIDNSRRTKHTALIDCELLSRVYVNLIDQKEPKLNFEEDKLSKEKNINFSPKNYFKKIVFPSKQEIVDHKNFLKKSLKKNYFN